jgi:hypothetical protein
VLGLLLCGWASIGPVAAAEALSAKEHQVKAAFIYNFAKFVEWPAGSFESTNSPLVIGVVGKSPISAALEATVKDRKINGRAIIVKGVETLAVARETHLLCFPASEDNRMNGLLPELAGSSVLTIGESGAFASTGGMINFIMEGDKFRFDINMSAAEKAGLKVSAQLQKLAKTVRRTP